MDEIEWEEPPPIKRDRRVPGKTQRFIAALRERPGEWAVYRRDHSTAPAGKYSKYPDVQWSVRKNDTDPPTWTLYARWVGKEA